MCHYCGCRHVPLIRDYIAEHERVLDLADAATRQLDHEDYDGATRTIAELADNLDRHWAGEENGLFAVLQRVEAYADYIAPLVQEHRDLAALLASLDVRDPDHQRRFRVAAVELHEHTLKEEDGLFPASLVEVTGAEWDLAIAAWQEAHPGQSLIAD